MKNNSAKKKTSIKELKIFSLIFLGLAIIVMIPVLIYLFGEYGQNRTVAKINGEAVSANEFKVNLLNNSANTYSYFKQKYGVDDCAEFWTASYGGEIPIEYARKKALEAITRIKIEQAIAKQKGIVKDISYSDFLKQLEEENKARKKAVGKGKVIYGPVTYGEREFFNYLHSNIIIKLKDNLGENEFKLSEDELKKIYEATKDKSYKNPDDIKVSYLKASGVDEKGNLKSDKKAKAKTKIEQLKVWIDKGESFENLAKTQGNDGNVKIMTGDRNFDINNRRSEGEDNSKLLDTANTLKFGQISGIVEEDDGFYILKCTERKDMGYRPFDEVKSSVKSNYVDEKFGEMVAKLIKDAKIEIIEGIYKKITVR